MASILGPAIHLGSVCWSGRLAGTEVDGGGPAPTKGAAVCGRRGIARELQKLCGGDGCVLSWVSNVAAWCPLWPGMPLICGRGHQLGRLNDAAAAGAWTTGAGGVIVVIIGGRGPAASARAKGEEGGVAAVSVVARPLLWCPAKISGGGQRRKGGRILLVPIGGKGNSKGKPEASSWF